MSAPALLFKKDIGQPLNCDIRSGLTTADLPVLAEDAPHRTPGEKYRPASLFT